MITKIKWNNHEILGNLELDFTKAGWSPYPSHQTFYPNCKSLQTIASHFERPFPID